MLRDREASKEIETDHLQEELASMGQRIFEQRNAIVERFVSKTSFTVKHRQLNLVI